MTVARLEEELLRIVRKHCTTATKAPITLDTRLDEAGIDSLTMSEIMFDLEDSLGVSIPELAPSSGGTFETLRELCAALAKGEESATAAGAGTASDA